MDDEFFEPRLGRVRSNSGRRESKYLHAVIASAARAGVVHRRSGRRFTGARIGRGAVAARLLGFADNHGGPRARRAIVKVRLVLLGGKGMTAARAHLRYIERDGASYERTQDSLYSTLEERVDGKTFLKRCEGDRHQFRVIVSLEDGDQYEDLRPLVRRFMTRMEQDLGTRLEWVAADHADTLHPHTHIMLRGKDDCGNGLVIAPDYIKFGMRERLCAIVSLDLGPRSDLEFEQRLRRDVHAERLTRMDCRLLEEAGPTRTVEAGGANMADRALRVGRLRKLGALGLADNLGGGRWQLAEGLEPTLRRLGERGDILRTVQRALTAAGIDRAAAEQVIHPAGTAPVITGRVIARGLADELHDRHYLIVDGIDGRLHYVDIGPGATIEPLPEGTVVRLAPRSIEDRESNQLERPSRNENFITRDAPVEMVLVSPLPLQRLAHHDGATWLDRELAAPGLAIRDAGFGRELRSALAERRAWLIDQGLAEAVGGSLACRPDMIAMLERRELLGTASSLSKKTGLKFVETPPGSRVEGIVRRHLDLAAGRFAIIETERSFALVPWRPVLARSMGRRVLGRVGSSGGISWSIGRQRGPEI